MRPSRAAGSCFGQLRPIGWARQTLCFLSEDGALSRVVDDRFADVLPLRPTTRAAGKHVQEHEGLVLGAPGLSSPRIPNTIVAPASSWTTRVPCSEGGPWLSRMCPIIRIARPVSQAETGSDSPGSRSRRSKLRSIGPCRVSVSTATSAAVPVESLEGRPRTPARNATPVASVSLGILLKLAHWSGAAAFGESGVAPADIKYVSIYDSFTIPVLMQPEDLGFCAKGEGGPAGGVW